jgi:hypothetical protein
MISCAFIPPSHQFLDPLDILPPFGQSALNERQRAVLPYGDIDLA